MTTAAAPDFAWIVPGSCPGVPFVDLLGAFRAELAEPGALVLRGPLAVGLYEGRLSTRPGTFASETLMLRLKEWPTLAEVPAGPFDFDHTRYEMVVPTFRVRVDGEDAGLVWIEMPSPEEMAARCVTSRFAFEVSGSGAHELRLEVPGAEKRLRWADLAWLKLRPDERRWLPLGAGVDARLARPRLFAAPGQMAALAAHRDPVQQALLDDLTRQLERGDDGSYDHRTALAALVGRLTGERRWIQEALERALALCARPHWGYHDVPEIMGWNNDRDTGMRMFETACVYDWLHDELSALQRKTMHEKLAYHAEIAYRVTRLQKAYWYVRTAGAHGQGFWFGLAAAAWVLWDEDPRARRWLEWVHGNQVDALAALPEDGIYRNVVEGPVFSTQWGILTALLLERAMGRKLSGELTFLKHYARNVAAYQQVAGERTRQAAALFFGLAARARDRRAQSDGLALARLDDPRKQELGAGVHPLAPLLYDPSVPAGRPTPGGAPSFHSRGGTVICRDGAKRARFLFHCGSPLGPTRHPLHDRFARATTLHTSLCGAFGWSVGGRPVLASHVPGYRARTSQANLISVDGAGLPMEGRYWGTALELDRLPRIESCQTAAGVTACRANLAPVYLPELGVRRMDRRWVFFHRAGMLVQYDRIVTERPRTLAWRLHTDGVIEERAAGLHAFRVDEAALFVRSVALVDDSGASPHSAIEPVHWVPSYGYGLNSYKTLEWQKEVHARHQKPPDYKALRLEPGGPCVNWRVVAVHALDEAPARNAQVTLLPYGVRVEAPGTWRVEFRDAGALRPEGPDGQDVPDKQGTEVDADVAVRVARGSGWLAFGARAWRREALRVAWPEPETIRWKEGCEVAEAL